MTRSIHTWILKRLSIQLAMVGALRFCSSKDDLKSRCLKKPGGEFMVTYCWWLNSCTTWDVWNPIDNGTFTISTGAGFQPSTVWKSKWYILVAKKIGKSNVENIYCHDLYPQRHNVLRLWSWLQIFGGKMSLGSSKNREKLRKSVRKIGKICKILFIKPESWYGNTLLNNRSSFFFVFVRHFLLGFLGLKPILQDGGLEIFPCWDAEHVSHCFTQTKVEVLW